MKIPNHVRVLIIIVLVGLFLRLFGLGTESLWSDEGYTYTFIKKASVISMLSAEAHDVVNPPGFYIVEHIWTVLTNVSEWNLRFPSALFGVGTILAAYWLGTRVKNSQVGLIAAALTAVSTYLVGYSQEARSYSMLTFITTVYVGLYLYRPATQRQGIARLVGLALLGVVGLYTHYAFIAILAGTAVWIVASHIKPAKWRAGVIELTHIVGSGVLFSHWFFISTYPKILSTTKNRFWQPSLEVSSAGDYIDRTLFLPNTLPNSITYLLLLGLIGSLVYVYLKSKNRTPNTLYLGVIVVFPFIFFWLKDVWLDRYTLLVIPIIYVLLATLLIRLPKTLLLIGAVSICVYTGLTFYVPYYSVAQKEGWREATQIVEDSVAQDRNGGIYVNKSFSQYPWRYYYDGGVKAHFPKNTFAGDGISVLASEMKQYNWVAIVYNNPTDDGALVEAANQDFSKHKVLKQSGGVTVHIFTEPR